MAIPFLDIQRQYESLKDEVRSAMDAVFRDAAYSGGAHVEAFERAFARYSETGFSSGLSSGTDALHLAVRALDIGPGDEVIVPANTFIATAWGVTHAGATPVFVDCDPETWTIDPAMAAAALTPRTRAVTGVHLYGQPFDFDRVAEAAAPGGLAVIEDCAQAVGARYRGRRVGGLGSIGCFSFYPGKNLGAYGEAGGTTAMSAALDARIKRLRNHGSSEKYYHEEIGFNMRMDGIHGAVLSLKLRYIDAWNARRREIASMYREGIRNPAVVMQRTPEWAEHVYHLFVIRTPERERFKRHLEAMGICPGIHYPVPCHLQKAYAHLGYGKGDFPNAEALSGECLSLPMFPELTDAEAASVIEAVNAF